MIIELTGLSGGGKSTVAKRLIKFLVENGYSVALADMVVVEIFGANKWRRFFAESWHQLLFSLKHVGLLWLVLSSQVGRPITLQHRFWVVRNFIHNAGRFHLLAQRLSATEIVIFDEGLLHRSAALFSSEKETADPGVLEKYVLKLPAPDWLLHLDAPPDICVARLQNRMLPKRMQGLGSKEIRSFLAHQAQTVSQAVTLAQKQGWNVASMVSDGAFSEIDESLQRLISEITKN